MCIKQIERSYYINTSQRGIKSMLASNPDYVELKVKQS